MTGHQTNWSERRRSWGSGGQAVLAVGGSIPSVIALVCCEAVLKA